MTKDMVKKGKFDVIVTIKYGVAHGGEYAMESNATTEGRMAILENALCSQFGKGADDRPANRELEWYTVRIGYSMDDTFVITHDCGNDGLMTGILADVYDKERKKNAVGR